MTCVCQRTSGKDLLLMWPSGKRERGGKGDDGGGEEWSIWRAGKV